MRRFIDKIPACLKHLQGVGFRTNLPVLEAEKSNAIKSPPLCVDSEGL
jgi:hypothetical protein